jgi:hypothetical protein
VGPSLRKLDFDQLEEWGDEAEEEDQKGVCGHGFQPFGISASGLKPHTTVQRDYIISVPPACSSLIRLILTMIERWIRKKISGSSDFSSVFIATWSR